MTVSFDFFHNYINFQDAFSLFQTKLEKTKCAVGGQEVYERLLIMYIRNHK